jgi:hypothetical protein
MKEGTPVSSSPRPSNPQPLEPGWRLERWLPHAAAGLLLAITAVAAVSATSASAARERPVILPGDDVAGFRRQLHERPGATMTVDLEAQTVTAPDGGRHAFATDPFPRRCLLEGLDEIGLTATYAEQIAAFERRHADEFAWAVPAGR